LTAERRDFYRNFYRTGRNDSISADTVQQDKTRKCR